MVLIITTQKEFQIFKFQGFFPIHFCCKNKKNQRKKRPIYKESNAAILLFGCTVSVKAAGNHSRAAEIWDSAGRRAYALQWKLLEGAGLPLPRAHAQQPSLFDKKSQ